MQAVRVEIQDRWGRPRKIDCVCAGQDREIPVRELGCLHALADGYFTRPLNELNGNRWEPDDQERLALAALAVTSEPELWGHEEGQVFLRAAADYIVRKAPALKRPATELELAIGLILGFASVDPDAPNLPADVGQSMALAQLRALVERPVTVFVDKLDDLVQHFWRDDGQIAAWATCVSEDLVNRNSWEGCRCADGSVSALGCAEDDPEEVLERIEAEGILNNPKRKVRNHLLHHRLSSWNPDEVSLAEFVKVAVIGGSGSLQLGNMTQGMLYPLIQKEWDLFDKFLLVRLCHIEPDQHGESYTPACHKSECRAQLGNQIRQLSKSRWFIIAREDGSGGFERRKVWKCPDPGCGEIHLAGESGEETCPRHIPPLARETGPGKRYSEAWEYTDLPDNPLVDAVPDLIDTFRRTGVEFQEWQWTAAEVILEDEARAGRNVYEITYDLSSPLLCKKVLREIAWDPNAPRERDELVRAFPSEVVKEEFQKFVADWRDGEI